MGLLLSGETLTLQEWDVDIILNQKKQSTKDLDICRLLQYEHDNTYGKQCNGLTYLEVEQLNNTYNNF